MHIKDSKALTFKNNNINYPNDIPPLIKPATTPDSASMSSVSDGGNTDL